MGVSCFYVKIIPKKEKNWRITFEDLISFTATRRESSERINLEKAPVLNLNQWWKFRKKKIIKHKNKDTNAAIYAYVDGYNACTSIHNMNEMVKY